MNRKKIVLYHIATFIGLSISWVFLCEPFLNIVAAGLTHVKMWIEAVLFGIVFFFVTCVISCLVLLKQASRKTQ